MPEQVPFIGRTEEFEMIEQLLRAQGTLRILCISAPGGIGKTRLLQEVHTRYVSQDLPQVKVTRIIDFDNYTYHIMENIGRQIATMLDKKTFEPYLQWLLDYRKLEKAGIGTERLSNEYAEGYWTFALCFNQLAATNRVILLFDTTDALRSKEFSEYLSQVGAQLENTLILVAGRNADEIGRLLQKYLAPEAIHFIELQPLYGEDGRTYLKKKQEVLHIELEPDLAEKLLLLSGGKPILIDLAVEWRTRGIKLEWLLEESIDTLKTLSEEQLQARRQEFERHLAIHIAQTRSQMDELILMLSRVYPMDVHMICTFLEIEQTDAQKLLEEARSYVFVKVLPGGHITLHDEMRRMINAYVWTEVDPENDRRRHDSRLAARYLQDLVQNISRKIKQYDQREKTVSVEKEGLESALDTFSQRETLEQEAWFLRSEYLKHVLFANPHQGFETFKKIFDEATQQYKYSFRQTLLAEIENYIEHLTPYQRNEINARRVQHLFEIGEYQQVCTLASHILTEPDLPSEHRISTLISRANAKIRLGDVKGGITDFEEALTICQDEDLLEWRIKTLNGLGWAYRMMGSLEDARKHYQDARSLYLQASAAQKERLKAVYGWISNNLAYVLSDNTHTRRTAVNVARSNIQHWKRTGDQLGLGAGYSMLGIAYLRSDREELALEAFQKAFDILEPLGVDYWRSQLYSWRGALYTRLNRLDEAKKDLLQALEIGTPSIRAMTLYRLGRVYMLENRLELAEERMWQTLQCAQEVLDYRYWLAALARLTMIAARQKQIQKFDELYEELQHCIQHVRKPSRNSLGMAFIGLAKLAILKNNPDKIPLITDILQQGIDLINESTYARADILSQLEFLEEDFATISPTIIRAIGHTLAEHSREKELENIDYSVVTPIMYNWASWKPQGNDS